MEELILEICKSHAVRRIDENTLSILFHYHSQIVEFGELYSDKIEYIESSGSQSIWAVFKLKNTNKQSTGRHNYQPGNGDGNYNGVDKNWA